MAKTKCGHCGNTTFEMKQVTPEGSNYKLFFIQCSSCGVPISSHEYMSISNMLNKQAAAIKKIARSMNIHVDL
jgi:predicted nucleic-acid-binding Zn-ribbon protein